MNVAAVAFAFAMGACLPAASAQEPASAGPGCMDPALLNTSRVIEIHPASPLHLGLKSYPQTLELAPREVVLTFDDGPSPTTTGKILDALRKECVKATFFLIGKNARANPELVRREIAEGHTVGHHTLSHATLRGLSEPKALTEIHDGIQADEAAGWGTEARGIDNLHVPFFRFPGFADTPALVADLDQHHIAVFGADLWAADWLPMTPQEELHRVMRLLDNPARRGGIILFHDIKMSTALMLPAFLRELKEKGYKVVQLRPSETAPPPPLFNAAPRWTSETDAIIAHLAERRARGSRAASSPPPQGESETR